MSREWYGCQERIGLFRCRCVLPEHRGNHMTAWRAWWEPVGFLADGINARGTPVSVLKCETCGIVTTVCPPVSDERKTRDGWGYGCLTPQCPSYDITRDIDIFFGALDENGLIERRDA